MKNSISYLLLLVNLGLSAQDPTTAGSINPPTTEPQTIATQPEEKKGYVSPEKGNLGSEYLKSLQITSRQKKAIGADKDTWFADRYKVGFGIRPKGDSIHNFDFDKSTADNRNNIVNQTQFYIIGDLTENILFKIAFQDVRLWGGEVIGGGASDQRYGVITNAGATYDTTRQRVVPVNNYTGLREAFFDLKTSNGILRLRTGRQILDFGDGRILGSRNDSLNGNSFDAVRLTTKYNQHTLDIFGSVLSAENNSNSLVANNATRFGGAGDAGYLGAHYTWKAFDWILVDLYNFSLLKQKLKVSNPPPYASEQLYRGADQLNTTGFRITNRTKNNGLPEGYKIDWMIEAAWQSGFNGERRSPDWINQDGNLQTNQKTGELSPFSKPVKYKANIIGAQLGYSPNKEWRIGIQYIQASGDPNRNDTSVATYNPLFATRRMAGHPLPFSGNGNSGAVFWQNVKDYSINIKYENAKYGTFILNPHWYYKVKLQDGYYDNNNYVRESTATGETASTEDYYNKEANNGLRPRLGNHVATEINFIYVVTPFDNVSFWFGASHLTAGDAIRNQKNNPLETDPFHRYDLKPNASYFTLQSVFAI
ncbi:alginate export family protein [Leptospira sp. 96542]|nr:alginate export family protein [Leptospira sp. 96542]